MQQAGRFNLLSRRRRRAVRKAWCGGSVITASYAGCLQHSFDPLQYMAFYTLDVLGQHRSGSFQVL